MVSFENTEIAFSSKSDAELRQAYRLFNLIGSPTLVSIGKPFTHLLVGLSPVRYLIKKTIYKQFCGGETIPECGQTTKVLDKYNIGTILDYSVEGKQNEDDFDKTFNEVCETIRTASDNPFIPFCVFKISGVCSFSMLKKLNYNKKLTPKEEIALENARKRVEKICALAAETGTPVLIDAEHSWIQNTIDDLAERMMAEYNKKAPIIYQTVQLYRKDKLEYLKRIHQDAIKGNYYLGIKPVRGAYMEKERNRAKEYNYPSPIQINKAATDFDFNMALEYCIQNIDSIGLCAGTHNEESSIFLVNLMKEYNIENGDRRVYFAQLYGMSDHISFNLSDAGFNVAKYVPYGPVNEVMPYLIRRAEENTSVAGQTGRELGLINKELSRRKNKA